MGFTATRFLWQQNKICSFPVFSTLDSIVPKIRTRKLMEMLHNVCTCRKIKSRRTVTSYEGVESHPHVFLTLALDGGGRSALSPRRSPLYSLSKSLVGSQCRYGNSGEEINLLPFTANRTTVCCLFRPWPSVYTY